MKGADRGPTGPGSRIGYRARKGRAGDAGLAAFLLVLALGAAATIFAGSDGSSDVSGEGAAALAMRGAMAALREELAEMGIEPDPALDPNGSGLIGLPWSGITTTLGSLPAKRSAAQPAAAALARRLLREAGVGPGELVAIDGSGSFPGFVIAAILASEGLGAEAAVIVSVGSSTYGANRPEFALPDMLAALARRGLIRSGAGAVSPGGAEDAGKDMNQAELESVLLRAGASGARIIRATTLESDVAQRRAYFAERAKGRPIAAFVSVGGNLPATGGLELMESGLILPQAGRRSRGARPGKPLGLIQLFLDEELPVLRLLEVKRLSIRNGLPYDPQPWPPDPGLAPSRRAPRPFLLAIPLLAFVAGGLVRRRAAKKRVLLTQVPDSGDS